MADPKRTTRIVYGVFIAGVGAFVASCIWQVAFAVFAGGGAAEPTSLKVERACADGIEELILGVDVALAGVAVGGHEQEARRSYATARDTKWTRRAEIEQACANDPNGKDALAAVARYDRAAEATIVRQANELTLVRNQAQSFISGHRR